MKLATLKDGSRDGLLVVVSRDLSQAHHAADVATTLQQLLDDWNFCSPPLQALYASLNAGKARHAFAFDPHQCMAPLPRGQVWVAAQAYPSHLARLCGDVEPKLPAGLMKRAPLQLRSSAAMSGPRGALLLASDSAHTQIDIEPALAVLTADLPAGSDADAATEAVRLLMVLNGWVLLDAPPASSAQAQGDLPAHLHAPVGAPLDAFLGAACSPVVVTPEELGPSWRQGKLHGTLESRINGRLLGRCDTASGMLFDFGQLLAQLASARALPAGCILSSGTVSVAELAGGPDDSQQAALCVAEQRVLRSQVLVSGTACLAPGDTVRVEFRNESGHAVFGVIEQQLRLPGGAVSDGRQAESAETARRSESAEKSEKAKESRPRAPAGKAPPQSAELPAPVPGSGAA